MKNPVKNDLHKNPQFFQDTIYMIDQSPFALYLNVRICNIRRCNGPATAVDGIPTVQPVPEQKTRRL